MFINGDLDGMWRLNTATFSDTTISVNNVYYSFQRHLIRIGYCSDTKLPNQEMEYHVGSFTHCGDSLTVEGFRHYLHEEIPTELTELQKYQLFKLSTSFFVAKLNDEKMVLTSDSATLCFEKW